MADRFITELKVGGAIQGRDVPGLLQELQALGASLDWGDPVFEPLTAQDLLDSREEGWLYLRDDAAGYTEFDSLKEFCSLHGIAYDFWIEGKHTYNPEVSRFRPGMARLESIRTATGEPVYQRCQLVPLREALARGDHSEARSQLEALLGPDLPALPPLEIVGPVLATVQEE